jgi:hypothetical protein
VRSRRFGRALGVNLLPRGLKICNMDCTRRFARWPTPEQVDRRASVLCRLRDDRAPEIRLMILLKRALAPAGPRSETISRGAP